VIYAFFILSTILLSLVALLLFRRLGSARRQMRQALLGPPYHPYLKALAGCLEAAIDDCLLTSGGAGGLGDLELRFREYQDPYRTVANLLDDVRRKVRVENDLPLDDLVKATYQLSYTLGIALDRLDPCLGVLIAAMKTGSGTRPVARVQTIGPGELVDTRTMVPLNYGSRVLYPLGVIAFDGEDRVLSRGRVICS
jgi:hypothetical protein